MVQRLIPPKAPNLPIGPVAYEQRYQDQFTNVLRLYFNQLDNVFGSLLNPGYSGALLQFPSASFQDNTTQVASVTYPSPMSYTQIDYQNQFTLADHTATFTGSRALTTLTTSSVSGYIYVGMHIIGTGWSTATYTASITDNVMNVTAVSSGTIAVGDYIVDGSGLATGARISQKLTGTGGTGTYEINVPDGSTISLSSTTINSYGIYITDQLTGTAGGAGTYSTSTSGTVASGTVTGRTTSKITAQVDGTYNFQWSGQFQNLNNASQDVYVWLRVNGVDLPGSTGQIGLLQRKSAGVPNKIIAAWNYLVPMNAGDYIELFWLVSSTDVTMSTYPKSTSPAYPATASLISTVSFVSALYT